MTINKAKAERATHFRKESPISAGRVRFISSGVQGESAGEAANVQPRKPIGAGCSTLNIQTPISNKTRYFRWIGRSEGDGTAKAAKPLISPRLNTQHPTSNFE
jgi:hypothetical protein